MTIVRELLEALQKVEEETGRPATSVDLTQEQWDELVKLTNSLRTFRVAEGLERPPIFHGVTIRVKK